MHHTYISPGVVDGAVAHAQAQKRQNDKYKPEETIVHNHKYGDECNDKCTTYPVVKRPTINTKNHG